MTIANYIGSIVFPDGNPVVQTSSIIDYAVSSLSGMLVTLTLTAGVLALFAFSLLIPTIPFIIAFFALSAILTSVYIVQLGLPLVFTAPIIAGVAITYYMGIAQYAARSSFQGS
jgi:hypothetical protein